MTNNTLFVVYYDVGIGGVQKKILDIIEYIAKNKDLSEKKIFLLLDGKRPFELKDDLFLSRILKNRVKVLRKPQMRFWRFRFPFSLYVIWQTLLYRPDTILAFMRKYAVISVLIKYFFWWRKIRVVVGYDNVASDELKDAVASPFKRNIWKKFIKLFFPLADVVIVPSETAKTDLINNFDILKKKVIVNKNWVAIPLKLPSKKGSSLVYIGRIDPQKNIVFMIDVIDEVKRVIPAVTLNIVGNGKQIAVVKKEISKRHLGSQIKLLGSKQNVSDYLTAASIFLLTSDYEGLPIAALEAMAYKLPVVATKYPGVDELIINNKNGFIAKNKKDYVEKVIRLLKDKNMRDKMGKEGLNHVQVHHNLSNLVKFVEFLN